MRLYIHIPFCASKCGYCAFASFVGEEAYFESYIDALCVDLTHILNAKNYRLSSIFIGGGTPNFLESKQYNKIFATIATYAHIEKDCEISIEANVNLLNTQWCKDLCALGVNRLSVGVQSFYEPKLAFLERNHSAKDIFHRVESAYNAGFTNLSCDMMITSLDNKMILESDITQALKLPINHISIYALSLDVGSYFASVESANNKVCESNKDEELSIFTRDMLKNAGFMQYEVSNYAKNLANRCAHNMGYWSGDEYLGAGVSAVGRVGLVREMAHTSLKKYLQNPIGRCIEHLESSHLRTEAIMLGLRCDRGFNIALLGEDSKDIVDMLVYGDKCFVRTEQDTHFLCAKELFLADEIALWILSRIK